MDLYVPNHLEPTRKLLHASLRMRPNEVPPAMPAELVSDLQKRFTATRKLIIEPPAPSESLFHQLIRFFSTPAIGATAIILGVLSFAIPALLPSDSTESFRGNSGAASLQAVPIYVTGGPLDMFEVLATSGDFQPEAILKIESREAALKLPGAKVIVDFGSGEVLSISDSGELIDHGPLPEDIEGVGIAVARAVSRL